MFGKAAGEILGRGIEAINDLSHEKSKISEVFKKIAAYPFKVLASFLIAPILVVKVAWKVEDPARRAIAVVGLLLSLVASCLAATSLGTLVGAVFVATHVGWLVGLGFLFGTTISVYLSVIFSIIVFNAVSWFFLKMNTQQVIDYLNEIST